MILDIKRNFPTQYNYNIVCDLRQVQVDCQEHLLSCGELTRHVNVPTEVKYTDIFSNTDKQLKIVKIFKQLLRTREVLNRPGNSGVSWYPSSQNIFEPAEYF